jgi:hypothetical protein
MREKIHHQQGLTQRKSEEAEERNINKNRKSEGTKTK